MNLHMGFGFQIAGEFAERRVRRLDYFVAQRRECLGSQRGRVAPGVRLRREAQPRAVLVYEAGDGAPSDIEEFGHFVQSVIVMFISESNLLS
ncbi:MAG TPA: hypothetical protein VF240_10780 [Pyrinomonadaceae bacterium]